MPTVSIDGGTMWYADQGDGTPIVCLHGGWVNSDCWRPQVEHFSEDYRIVTPDLRGHGRTGETDVDTYSIDLYVEDLERLLDHLDVEKPILVGVSLGGVIIQSVLDRTPERLEAAVIAGPLQSMPPVDLPLAMKPFLSPLPAITGMVETMGPRATFLSLLTSIKAITGKPWLTVDEAVRSDAMDALDDVTPTAYREIFRALYEFVPPDLSGVRTPTLLVYGDHEASSVKRQAKRLANALERSTITEIPEAGHLVNLDQPAAFNDECAEFFAALSLPTETNAAD